MSIERTRVYAGIATLLICIGAIAWIAIVRDDEAAKGALIAVVSAGAGYIYRGQVTAPPDSPARRRP